LTTRVRGTSPKDFNPVRSSSAMRVESEKVVRAQDEVVLQSEDFP
jgi:hypothetical protein